MSVKFILFDLSTALVQKWHEAFRALVPPDALQHITIVEADFDTLKSDNHFDCIVSPANSFGRLDGSFDQILSDNLSPPDDEDALTRTAQAVLYRRWRGFAPPGTCTLVPLAHSPCAPHGAAFGCRFVALCPTMRIPASVTWHREIVYNAVWSLLVAVDEHNAQATEEERIQTVAMTGLATGVGRVSAEVCATQMALAFAHYHEAKTNPEKWSALRWPDICAMPLNVRLPDVRQESAGESTRRRSTLYTKLFQRKGTP